MSTKYFTGKGYGVSNLTDISGEPLLTWTDPTTGKTIICADRCAVVQDPTIAAPWSTANLYTPRLDEATSSAIKKVVGGTSAQNLDHKIPLELGGSNQLANLALEALDPSTGAQASNPFENGVSADVLSGKISLLQGWKEMSAGKGFALAEVTGIQQNNNFASAASSVLAAIKTLISNKNFSSLNATLQAQIKQDGDQLAITPFNLALREKVFTEQVNFTAQQLGITTQQAQQYIATWTAQYGNTKGTAPNELLGALTANEQQIFGISAAVPKTGGINNTTWANISIYLTEGQTALLVVAGIAAVITVLTGGLADAAAAAVGGGISGILAAFGASLPFGVAVGSFAVAEVLGSIASRIPMITKQMADNGFIIPSLTASALNDDINQIKKAGGGTTTTTTSSTVSGGSSSAPHSAPSGNILISAVSSGVVGSAAAFTPRPTDIIESATDLTTAAQNNLSSYLTALPGILGYDIKLSPHVTADDGSIRFGGTNRVIKGYTTKGKAEYKNVTNKFAVLEIYYVPSPRKRTILDKIVLGPIDEANYSPAEADLADIITHLQENFVITAPGTETLGAPTPLSPQGQTDLGTSPTTTGTTAAQTTPLTLSTTGSALPACSATTLSDFYSRQSLSYPTVVARSVVYEQAGLGTASTYTGSAEQNTKLLQHLQSALGCFVSAAPAGQTVVAAPLIVPTTTQQVDPSLLPTTQQLANRLNPIAVTVTYPTTGLFHNTGGFGEEISKRVGGTWWQLNFSSPPFDTLYKGVSGGGNQAQIVDAWLKSTFGFDIMALPQFNYADLTTDRTITHRASFNAAGEPGEGIVDPKALITLFLQTDGSPAGQTTATLN